MTKKLLFVVTLALVAAFALMAADVSGKWTFEQAGRQGGTPRQITMTLKAEGGTLNGSMPGFARGGGYPPPATQITDGKVNGNDLSFTVKRDMNGTTVVTKYEGTVAGDEMKLKITRPGQDGTPVVTDVTAKRSTT